MLLGSVSITEGLVLRMKLDVAKVERWNEKHGNITSMTDVSGKEGPKKD